MTRTLALAVLALAVPAAAQTTDDFWRHWSSREERSAPRTAALGGADVALTDDAPAAVTNPALLTTLWRTEIVAGAGDGSRGKLGQLQAARWSPDNVAVSVYARRPVSLTQGDTHTRLEHELSEAGVLVARRLTPSLALGVGVHVARLEIAGQATSLTSTGARAQAGAGARTARPGGTLGVLWHTPTWSAGAAFHTGATFEGMRTSTRDAAWEDRGSTFDVRRPWRAVVGGSYRASLRLSVLGQVDLRGAGKLRAIEKAAGAPERAGLAALRAGAQYALPLERASVVLRAGVARLSEAGVRNGAALVPTKPATTRVSAGIGLAWDTAAVDVGYDGAGRWSVEARVRLWR